MKYLRITPYLYLLFGLYFVYHGYTEYQAGNAPWLSFGIAALAVFMFFFRLRFVKRFEERNKK